MKTNDARDAGLSKDIEGFKRNDAWFGGLSGMIRFEPYSRAGRVLYRPDPSTYAHKQLLNIGSGNRPFDEFVNLDFYRRWDKPDVMHDLRFPLPFPDERFAGIFSEHCFERFRKELLPASTLRPASHNTGLQRNRFAHVAQAKHHS